MYFVLLMSIVPATLLSSQRSGAIGSRSRHDTSLPLARLALYPVGAGGGLGDVREDEDVEARETAFIAGERSRRIVDPVVQTRLGTVPAPAPLSVRPMRRGSA